VHVIEQRPVGAEVRDVDLAHLHDEQVAELRRLLGEHGVLVMPGQDALDDDGFAAFLRRFGDLTFTAGETPVPGRDDLNVVSNVGRTTPPRSVFHTDTSYVARPPLYTALRAVTIPDSGGETLFTNQYRAYDTLPSDIRMHLAGRTITHVVSGLRPEDAGPETSAEHPVFRRHPVSGRTALYLSTPERCVAMSDMDRGAARQTIGYLYEHSTAEDNTFRHAWSPGDVVMWDNGCVLHRADHSDVTGDRVMHRGMVAA
jgi:taurine dioxygenase